MAKKTRKTNRPNVSAEALERARREMYAVPAEPEAIAATATVTAPAPRKMVMVPRVVNLREEYAYVLKDLRNMAILAAALMVVLTIMSLFI